MKCDECGKIKGSIKGRRSKNCLGYICKECLSNQNPFDFKMVKR